MTVVRHLGLWKLDGKIKEWVGSIRSGLRKKHRRETDPVDFLDRDRVRGLASEESREVPRKVQ